MEKEEQLLIKRIGELARLCYERDILTGTDFLSLSEQAIFQTISGTLPPVRYELTGGFLTSERKVLCFLPSYLETAQDALPFDCLRIAPVNPKFAEELTHRDYLGALMGLGIERGVCGDIIVKDGEAYVFVLKKMSRFLTENLTQVRHTSVFAELCENGLETVSPEYRELCGSVNSLRLDCVVALAGRLSRAKAAGLIESEKVAVNGRTELSVSRTVKEGDVLSVRGIGKFRVGAEGAQTKKGRIMLTLYQYS